MKLKLDENLGKRGRSILQEAGHGIDLGDVGMSGRAGHHGSIPFPTPTK
jgi:hypothetical protein